MTGADGRNAEEPSGTGGLTRDDLRAKLCSGVAVVPSGDGYLFDGGLRRQLVRGAAAGKLRAVLPLLDGARTGAQICSEASLAPADLRQLLALLHRSGLLEWEPPPLPVAAAAPDLPRPTADYLSRTISTSGFGSVVEIAEALHATAVVISAAGPVSERISVDLLAAGIGRVVVGASETHVAEIVDRPNRLAIAVEPFATATFLQACDASDVPVLRTGATAQHWEIGPVLAAAAACTDCLCDGREARLGSIVEPPVEPADSDIFAGLVATHALAVLTRQPDRLPGTLFAYDARDLTRTSYVVTPRTDCPRCGSAADPDSPGALAEDYESQVRLLPTSLRPRRDDSAAGLKVIESVKTERASFPTAPRRPMPHPAAAGEPHGGPPWPGPTIAVGSASEEVLASIMARVVGLRDSHDGPSGRWTPTGGDLASPEAYLLCGRTMFGCAAGTLFRYDDVRHELIAPRSDLVDLDTCLARAGLPAEPPVAMVFLVAGIGRLSRKYGRFAYRLAHLDAGCAMTQLAAVGAGYGVRVVHATSWHRTLVDDVLELIRGKELLTSVSAIYESERRDAASA